jgi:hypothetical protein
VATSTYDDQHSEGTFRKQFTASSIGPQRKPKERSGPPAADTTWAKHSDVREHNDDCSSRSCADAEADAVSPTPRTRRDVDVDVNASQPA